MPAKTAFRAKGRANVKSFVAVPHEVLNHPNFTRLSGHAVKLLFDLCALYKGNNNGDLSLPWTYLSGRRWTSKTLVARAKRELLHYGWIIQTRQGANRVPSLYAFTWKPIDPCGGKLDHGATSVAPGNWRVEREPWIRPKRPPPDPSRLLNKTESAAHPVYRSGPPRVPLRKPNGEF